jgi:hypothetical protein
VQVGLITNAVALDSAGRPLVACKKTGNTVGNSSDDRGVNGLATIGDQPYLAEGGAVTTLLPSPTRVPGATAVPGITAVGPTAITSDNSATQFVADTPGANSTILRYSVTTQTTDALLYATAGPRRRLDRRHAGCRRALARCRRRPVLQRRPSAGAQTLEGHLRKVPAG